MTKWEKVKHWIITTLIPLTTKAMVKYLKNKGYVIVEPKKK